MNRTKTQFQDARDPDIWLNLFNGKEFPVRISRVVHGDNGTTTTYGKVMNAIASQVILVAKDDVLSGSVFAHGHETTRIIYAGDGVHTIAEIDPATSPRCAGEAVLVPGAVPTGSFVPRTAGDGEAVIDLMVVYTAAARIGAGGTTAMQTLIDLAVAESNIYANSGVDVELRLVHRSEVTYTESGSASTDLTRLQASGDGQLDSVLTLRTNYGADVVILITESMAT